MINHKTGSQKVLIELTIFYASRRSQTSMKCKALPEVFQQCLASSYNEHQKVKFQLLYLHFILSHICFLLANRNIAKMLVWNFLKQSGLDTLNSNKHSWMLFGHYDVQSNSSNLMMPNYCPDIRATVVYLANEYKYSK